MMTQSGTWFPLRHHIPSYYGATMQSKFHDISIYLSGFSEIVSTDAALTDYEQTKNLAQFELRSSQP